MKPSFFILGFPKCGTTSLAQYLREHPEVLISRHKEPHYFAFDFTSPTLRVVTTEEQYREQFDTSRHYTIAGEASTGYIYSDEAIDRILAYQPQAKFVIVVRDPTQMVLSEHAQMLKSGHETIEDFFEAWQYSGRRLAGHDLPRMDLERILVAYAEFGRVGTYLERAIEKIGRQRLHVIVYDDMLADMRSVYKNLLDFLGVADDGRCDFPVYNTRRFHRFRMLANFINEPPSSLLKANDRVKRVLGIQRIGVMDWLREKNLKQQRQAVPQSVLEQVRTHFADEVAKVEKILGRDLGWHAPEAAALSKS
jgi:hypothetical protein